MGIFGRDDARRFDFNGISANSVIAREFQLGRDWINVSGLGVIRRVQRRDVVHGIKGAGRTVDGY